MRLTVVFDENDKPCREIVDSYSSFEYIPLSKEEAIAITESEIKKIENNLERAKSILTKLSK